MGSETPSVETLRALLAAQGVHPSGEDLAGVQGFLAVLLPAFAELERRVPPDTVPAGLPFPGAEDAPSAPTGRPAGRQEGWS